jgi:peptidoglycan/xylan/chitin deacetylase (PgdA/CDA1 family)
MERAVAVGLPVAAGCAAMGLLWRTISSPRSDFWGPVVYRGDAGGRPRYALTFDDGPTEGPTCRILDALGEAGAKATFFVIGRNVRRWPKVCRRMADEGHVVANHTMDHSHYGVFRLRRYWERQITETRDLIADVIGRRPALFRPPMGLRTGHCTNAARRSGHRLVTWTRRAVDGVRTTRERILERLAPTTQAGDILVLHDGIEPNGFDRDPEATVEAVGELIRRLRERGLEAARVDEMAGVGAYQEEA